jgi:site-specific DNA recombinase
VVSFEVESVHRQLRVDKRGQWVSSAAIGYKNIPDEFNRPIVVPHEKNAPFIRKAFEELATGAFNQEEVRRRLNEKGFKCSRNNFNHLLRNQIYAGKILIPAYKEEEAITVQGIHEPIVEESLFLEVQEILSGGKPKRKVKNTRRDELPLRGFLKCAQCGELLTGNASRGKLGKRYFYYHCDNGCPERFSAAKANQAFKEYLSTLKVDHDVINFCCDILKAVFKENEKDKTVEIRKLEEEISKNQECINQATQMRLDKEIETEEFRNIKNRYDKINADL